MFESLSGPATSIRQVANFILGVTAAIFAIVTCLIVIALVRFRRKGDGTREPPQVYGSNQLETAWTVLPMLIVLVLALTTRADHPGGAGRRDGPPTPSTSPSSDISGGGRSAIPSLGIVTANELHVPVSDPRAPTPDLARRSLSADVAHSFWVPRLAGKTDLIPNRVNHMWIAPTTPGLYLGPVRRVLRHAARQDAAARVRAPARGVRALGSGAGRSRADRRRRRQPAARVFERTGCVNCHTLAGTIANGRYGPDLTHLMSRDDAGRRGRAQHAARRCAAGSQQPGRASSRARTCRR